MHILGHIAVGNSKYSDKKKYIIGKCYECFVKNGIENTTTRDFCAAADINTNTLYYYFRSKNQVLIECVNYGFTLLESAFFDALKEFDKSSFDIFPHLVNIGLDFAPQLRFLQQAVSSPSFEPYREAQFKKVNEIYDRLGIKLAERFDCPYELIRSYVYETMTLMSYFTLWGSRDMAAIQFSRIFTDFKDAVLNYKKVTDSLKIAAG